MKLTLKAARANKGLRQDEVAKMVRVNPATLSSCENKPLGAKLGLVLKLCELYGIEIGDIFLESKN